jgi:hypothetical protein
LQKHHRLQSGRDADCVHHASLEQELGAEALREGRYPPRRTMKSAAMPVVVETSATVAEASSENGTAQRDPTRVRLGLAEGAAESFDAIRRTLIDAATSASKQAWIEFECGVWHPQARGCPGS